MFNKYPYTDFHELNLDWFLSEFKTLQQSFTTLEEAVEAFKNYVMSYLDNLDLQDEVSRKIDQMVASGAFTDLLSPVVAGQLSPVVSDQIGGVVENQLPGVVDDQLPGVVGDQLPVLIGTQVTDWLNANVDPVGSAVIVDSTLTIAGAAADAKVTGAARYFSSRTLTPIKPKWNVGYVNKYGVIITEDPTFPERRYSDPIICPAGKTVKYVGLTNVESVAAVSFWDIDMNFVGYVSNTGSIGPERSTIAPASTWYCIVTTVDTMVNSSYAIIDSSVYDTINNMNQMYHKKVVYINPMGDDSDDGSSMYPVKTLGRAVELGADVVIAAAGYYTEPGTVTIQKDDFRFYVTPTGPAITNGHKPKAIFDNGTELTVTSDAGTGLLVASKTFASTSNWYKVFVTHTLPVSPEGTSSTTYNAILWEGTKYQINQAYDPTNDLKLKPVLTLEECQSTTGSFFYDDYVGKVYINPSGTVSNAVYQYLDVENGTIVTITNRKNVHFEDLELRHSPEYGFYMMTSDEIRFDGCVSGHVAVRDGFIVNRSVVEFHSCEAYKCAGDGFSVTRSGSGNFFNCESHHNYDDGISHGAGSVGIIDGGWCTNNIRAGIASPWSGAKVNIKGVLTSENKYGIYVASGSDTCSVNDCAIVDNTYGLMNVGYTLLTFNNRFSGNGTNTAGTGNTIVY